MTHKPFLWFPKLSLYQNPPQSSRPMDSVVRVFETNCLGPLAVTRGFLALLHRGSTRTVVNISSGSGITSYRSQAAASPDPAPMVLTTGIGYAMSKAALQMRRLSGR